MDKSILIKLDKFLDEFEHKDDVVGVLACGSYVTGHPNSHSDLDVHLILNENVDYRERGNRIIDGLLIEYFANTKRQILAYFDEDYRDLRPMSQTQFATGEIIKDYKNTIKNLKTLATKQLNKKFKDIKTEPNPLTLYGIWDSVDDLEAVYQEKRPDFDFIYYNKLDKLLSVCFKDLKIPYNCKAIYGHLTNEIVRNKYLLDEVEDKELCKNIIICITKKHKKTRLKAYKALATRLLEKYKFNIETFSLKSKEDC